MKIVGKKILVLIFIAFFSVAIQGKVAPLPLEDLVKKSDLIVIGEVLSVDYVEGIYFANVKVMKTLKGNSTSNIYYSTERTWACDVSGAEKGESALFFFDKYEIKPNRFRNSEENNLFKNKVERLTNGANLFRLSFSGRGRMPFLENDKDVSLKISREIILPTGLSFALSEVVSYTNKILSNS